MKRREFIVSSLAFAGGLLMGNDAQAAEIFNPGASTGKVLALPDPDRSEGLPLNQCLFLRRAERNFKQVAVGLQELSNLLWAACGVNRRDGRRTIPTALNQQKIYVWVAREDGLWLYNATDHNLIQCVDKDLRSELDNSPLMFIYGAGKEDQYAPFHIGSAYQNVGLECASLGLGNCIKSRYQSKLTQELSLKPDHKIYIVQAIGWPA